MFGLSSHIAITDPTGTNFIEFNFVNEVEIDRSRRKLTTTATVKVARKLKILNGDINDIIKRGSKIIVQLGYDDNYTEEFTGYVTGLGAKIPLEIKCEDSMWTLKQNSFSKAWKNVKVAEIIDYIYKGAAQVVDLKIGGLIVKQQSTAQILDDLKKFGLQCYFDEGILIVDFAGAVHNKGKEVNFDFVKNVVANDNLEYKLKDDARIKVRATSKLATGKKIELVLGDNDGEEHTLHYVNMDKDQLQKIATAELDKLKYNGFKGSFKAFGLPTIKPGDIAVLNDPDYPEHNGAYLVEAVKTTYGMDGYRHEITPERKVA